MKDKTDGKEGGEQLQAEGRVSAKDGDRGGSRSSGNQEGRCRETKVRMEVADG